VYARGSFAHGRAGAPALPPLHPDGLLLPNYHLDVNIIDFEAVIELVTRSLEPLSQSPGSNVIFYDTKHCSFDVIDRGIVHTYTFS
jgi:hypothetical protein